MPTSNEVIADTLSDLQECVAQIPYLLTLLAGTIEAEKRQPFCIPTFDETHPVA
jgi:hypothetical protein